MRNILVVLLFCLLSGATEMSGDDRLPDQLTSLSPSDVHLNGYLGSRVASNEKNRLVAVDEDSLLAGFRNRPGQQAWIGEHVGKWLHAATLAWVNTGDSQLRAKLDRVVLELLKTQEPDGYLGTYTQDKHFGLYPGADWDVWVHKYDLVGLLSYYQFTHVPEALEASRKIGDLLIRTFGPDKKSIISAGTHVGMAATSVLEPMVLLYRATSDSRYLDFAWYIVRSWDEQGGPGIIATLTSERSVSKTANAKAYEMLSNLVGLCELSRVTGDRSLLEPVVKAWEDIVANHLYITGSASSHEHFHADHDLPNQPSANVGETCVTVTWIQLNGQLLRLTGDARYADELERSYYNHLSAAQRPDGAEWCYYTALEGTKPYGPGINCCVSSGPRGMAMAPQLSYLKYKSGGIDGIAVVFFESSQCKVQLDGKHVTLIQESEFPFGGRSTIRMNMGAPATFALRVRSPAWASPFKARLNRDNKERSGAKGEWLSIGPRTWRNGDQVTLSFNIPQRRIIGDYTNTGRAALMWGPIVLAYDEKKNPGMPPPAGLAFVDDPSQPPFVVDSGEKKSLLFHAGVQTARSPDAVSATFVPFAEAGSDGGRYRVWLRTPGAEIPANESLFGFAHESRSRTGNVTGEIADGDLNSFVVTFDGTRKDEDWFAIELNAPVTIRRIVFAHGKTFHDGGWFDASRGKPRVQIRAKKGGEWLTIGTLEEYPETTATDHRNIKSGRQFTLRLKDPIEAVEIRVIGVPAHGDNAKQAFSSCAELQAFGSP